MLAGILVTSLLLALGRVDGDAAPSGADASPDAVARAAAVAPTGPATAEPAAPTVRRREVPSDGPPIRGVARPGRRAVLAVPFEGRLGAVHAVEGQRVAAGEVLARLDDAVALASLAAARVASEREGRVDYAEQDLELQRTRLRRLEESGAATAFELEEARVRVAQAAANLRTAQEDVRQAARNLDLETARVEQLRIRAPFAGRVLRVHASPGEARRPTDALIELVDLATLDVDIHVPVDTWTRLAVGGRYRLLADAPVNGPLPAVLRTAEPVIDAGTRTVRCVFEIDNRALGLPAGFTVRLDPGHLLADAATD